MIKNLCDSLCPLRLYGEMEWIPACAGMTGRDVWLKPIETALKNLDFFHKYAKYLA
jgi:hypothetical protein